MQRVRQLMNAVDCMVVEDSCGDSCRGCEGGSCSDGCGGLTAVDMEKATAVGVMDAEENLT